MQILIKRSERLRYVFDTNPNKCSFLSCFFAEYVVHVQTLPILHFQFPTITFDINDIFSPSASTDLDSEINISIHINFFNRSSEKYSIGFLSFVTLFTLALDSRYLYIYPKPSFIVQGGAKYEP